MKKIIPITLMTIFLFVACKKKEDSAANTNSTTTGTTTGPAPFVSIMTAKVNNVNWAMANDQTNPASSSSKVMTTYAFMGKNSYMSPYTSIELYFKNATGVFNFTNLPNNYKAEYKDSSNTYYTAKTGTINVTLIDTLTASQGLISKFKATFSFSTDTINNKSYIITNGVVDYVKP